jgi:hypothetical protein
LISQTFTELSSEPETKAFTLLFAERQVTQSE